MDVERARALLLKLPHVAETLQWGENLVFWAGDKAIGGKMFALLPLDAPSGPVVSFAAGPERAAELLELEGFRPAPYFARLHWVAAERWDVLSARDWAQAFEAAHAIVSAKLAPRTREVLALPPHERAREIVERRAVLAAKSTQKSPRSSATRKASATSRSGTEGRTQRSS